MTDEQIRALGAAFAAELRRYRGCFGQDRTAAHFDTYCRGLLSDLPRKTVEPIALAAGHRNPAVQDGGFSCAKSRIFPRRLRRSVVDGDLRCGAGSGGTPPGEEKAVRTLPLIVTLVVSPVFADEMPRVVVSKDRKGFALEASGHSFTPWGFNYDHDDKGRLLEDYWEADWPKVETDFARMKKLGANVVRVHLQLGRFMDGPDKPNAQALDRLAKLVGVAESTGLYLNLTGLGCYHKADVPGWYDKLAETDRWDVQARFWEAVAGRCADRPAVFCYDLMNEPVVPGGRRKDGDWLGPAFAGKHFVQFITLDQKDRPRPDIARQWVDHLVAAVRKADKRHLVTVGLVDWSLDRKGLTSGFVPEKVTEKLDFVSVHIYPEAGKLDEATKTLKGFAVGKPVVVEETFPLKCSPKQLDEFIEKSGTDAAGWVSFYWGKPPEELRRSKEIGDAILMQWLELFEKRARTITK